MSLKAVFACGGSGGHIFPAFSVAEELRRRDARAQIVYVCGEKDVESEIFRLVAGESVVAIDARPFRGMRSILSPRFWHGNGRGFFRSLALLRRERPDLVVGFGGYVSFPVVAAAKVLGVPVLVHEQNAVPGTANRALANLADGVALSFNETLPRFARCRRVRVTGNPIRSAIERDCRRESIEFFGFCPDRRTLLVLGGSQGSESINALFLASIEWIPQCVLEGLQVLHLCGRMSAGRAEEVYQKHGVPARAYSFFERMDLAYGAADLAVGRAGATFLAEIAAKRIPAILIPYPYAGAHQSANARLYPGEAIVAEQAGLDPQKLAKLVVESLDRGGARGAARPNASRNARVELADFISEVAAQ